MTTPLAMGGRCRHLVDVVGVPDRVGRLLSVAELQHALHLARATSPVAVAVGSASARAPRPILQVQLRPTLPPEPPDHTVAELAQPTSQPRPSRPDPHRGTLPPAVEPPTGRREVLRARPATTWMAVVGAHGGAGASTVAVALADAAATDGRPAHLIGHAAPGSCGLGAVTSVELGITDDGHWRRGRRGRHIIVDRFAGSEPANPDWPPFEHPGSGQEPLTILDVERAAGRPGGSPLPAAVVLVFRVTVPGVQHAERVLAELGQSGGIAPGNCPVLLAAVGPDRWPGVVTSAAGPLLGQRQRGGQLVSVPVDRRLERTGLTGSPLPKAVAGAGRDLLRLLEPAVHPSRSVAARHLRDPLTPPLAARPAVPAGPPTGDLTEKDNPR